MRLDAIQPAAGQSGGPAEDGVGAAGRADRRVGWRSSRPRLLLVAICAAALALAGTGRPAEAQPDPTEESESRPKRKKTRPKRAKSTPEATPGSANPRPRRTRGTRRPPKDTKDTDTKDTNDANDANDAKDAKDAKDPSDPKDAKDTPGQPGQGAGDSVIEPPLPEGLGGGGGGSKDEPPPRRLGGGGGGSKDEPPPPRRLGGSGGESKDEPPLPEGLGGGGGGSKDEPPLPEGLGGGGDGGAGEPALPEGLGGDGGGGTDPGVPPGLEGAGNGNGNKEPDVPQGLGDGDKVNRSDSDQKLRLPKLSGFGEYRGGARVMDDPAQDQSTLSEGRLHLEMEYVISKFSLKAGADFTYGYDEGSIELREASISFTPLEFLDLKVGRQILSWGTSTSLFINDLFSKDYFAFLLGRNTEQLKAPSDAVKASLFSDFGNLDIVYVPRFNSDRFLTGERLSFYNPLKMKVTGQDDIVTAIVPDRELEDDEFHLRLSKNLRGGELAAYGYRGFWKSPAGFNPMTMQFTFPRLDVYGMSFRDQLGQGIGHFEAGYYRSRDDVDEKNVVGNNPLVNNSEFRFLAGYERQAPKIADDLTLGFEYYLELMLNYTLYKSGLPLGFPARDEYRHVIVLQLVKLLYKQNITLQFYAYVSPTDADVYVRSSLDFRLDDHFTFTAGTNLFTGAEDTTFYGQLETNSNVYLALRYGF